MLAFVFVVIVILNHDTKSRQAAKAAYIRTNDEYFVEGCTNMVVSSIECHMACVLHCVPHVYILVGYQVGA